MNTPARIVLIGAGAMGLPIARKLNLCPDIELLIGVDESRVKRYSRDGLFLNGERVDLSFASAGAVRSFAPELVIIATKNGALPEVLDFMAAAGLEKSVVLPILNGISARDIIQNRFPEAKVFYGLFLGHASVRQGNHVTFDGCGRICFGDADNRQVSQTAARTAELFEKAGVEYEIPADMLNVMWTKFVINVGINQTQGYFLANYGEVQKDPAKRAFAETLMREAVGIARALKINGTDKMISQAMQLIMSMPPEVKTSMLQDIEADRDTEVAAFAGTVCALGAKLGVPTPANRMILSKITR